MPTVTYPEQTLKSNALKELFQKYFTPEYVNNNIFNHEDKVKLEFYKDMIRNEDYHVIAEDIHERSSFYGKYNVYTKNKLTKARIRDLRKTTT